MRTVIQIAQRAHSMYMPSHPWNFEVLGIWQVNLANITIIKTSSNWSFRRQLDVPQEMVHEYLDCSEKSASMLRYLVSPSETGSDEEDV